MQNTLDAHKIDREPKVIISSTNNMVKEAPASFKINYLKKKSKLKKKPIDKKVSSPNVMQLVKTVNSLHMNF